MNRKSESQPQSEADKAAASNPDLQGEGNYVAGRRYDEATKRYVDEGKVEAAAAAAKPDSPQEQRDMERAEEEGKSHAKGEDPALRKGAGKGDDLPRSKPDDRQR